ncbi:MAG: DUF4837 family protein [Salibacteraceae bacterium]
MKYIKKAGFIFSLLLVVLNACKEEKKNEMFMSVSGNPGELIIVATEPQWDGLIGETCREHFEKPVYGMPQQEPLFDLVRTNYSDFERVFKTFRNVLIVEIDTTRFSKPNIEYRKDVFAKGQLVIRLEASSRDEIVELINTHSKQIIRVVQTKELNRLGAKFKAKPNKKAQKSILSNLGIKVTIPKEAVLASIDSSHAWVRLEREKLKGGYQHQISQGLLIFKYPYQAKQQFLDSELFKMRDAKLKKHIQGTVEGSYLTTEYRYYPPVTKEVDYNGHFAKEIHGLWRMEGDFMGGPMATYFVLNEEEGMIYCISGYAFAPQFKKREYYREIEAVAKSVKF